jgi:mRNA-degrading endonuclease YafQ of YafQ-DinJ toxin-antitoxin module
MQISHIYYHPQFRKSFLDLPEGLQNIAKVKIILFKNNPFEASLKTHKLHGKLKNQWSFAIKGQYRILFVFDKIDAIFLDIGPHDIYK